MGYIGILIAFILITGIGVGFLIFLLSLFGIAILGNLSALIIKLKRQSNIEEGREVHKASLIISNILLVVGILCALLLTFILCYIFQ